MANRRRPRLPLFPVALLLLLLALSSSGHLLPLAHAVSTASIFEAMPPDAAAVDANDPRFGLVGDGVHDDTDGLLAALNATYYSSSSDPPRPNCTLPGARTVFLRGPATYRLTRPVDIRTWQRLVGWGPTRPVLLLGPSTPGYANASQPTPMLRANDYAPGADTPKNSTDGNNIAFGIGVINVDFEIAPGNPGAVALRWRVAQGGLVRSARFTLASDALAGIYFPGWAHQDLVFEGGSFGIVVGDTGAWPSSYRDLAFSGQVVSAIAQANFNGPPFPFPAGDWEGSVFTRATFSNVPRAFLALPAVELSPPTPSPVRLILRHCRFSNVSAAIVTLGNVSWPAAALTVLDVAGDAPLPPFVLEVTEAGQEGKSVPSPASPAPPAPPALLASFVHLGWDSPSIDTHGPGPVPPPRLSLAADVVPLSSAAPPLPPTDIPPIPHPVSSWVNARAHGVAGDGVTDDTAALTALLAQSPAAGPVFLASGVYLLSSTLVIPPGAALFGLHPWDVVLRLSDDAVGFKDPLNRVPIVHLLPGDARTTTTPAASPPNTSSLRIGGLNIQSGSGRYAAPQPAPVPPGWANPNPGAIGLAWEAGGETAPGSGVPAHGAADLWFHPASFPDNARLGNGTNTEVSLWIRGGGTAAIADVWTCNSYADGGTWLTDSPGPTVFYQLSDEHHNQHEVWARNTSRLSIWTMQTEDREADCPQTLPFSCEACSNVTVAALQTNRGANSTTGPAVLVDGRTTGFLALHLHVYVWDYHHPVPVNFNASVCDAGSGACAAAVDVGLVTVRV